MAVSMFAHAQDPYADSVVSYVTGTGAGFVASYNISSSALGAPTSGAIITAPAVGNTNLVGVGEGGELTVAFTTPITDDPINHADGMDFTIFGNQFFALGGSDIASIYNHTGLTVWVSQDGTTFYQLVAPDSLAHGADDLYPTEGTGDASLPVNPSLSLSSFVGQTSADALSLYNGSAGGSSYSISWAEDTSGSSVNLTSVSYIKVEGSAGYGYVDAISRVETIPEPAPLALGLLGAAALLCVLRSKKIRGPFKKLPAGLFIGAAVLLTAGASAHAQTFTLSNIQYWVGSGTNQSALVISWNDGLTPDSLVFGYDWNAPATGPGPTMYTMMQAIQAADPLLVFTANPEFNSPTSYALYSAFYNLTGGVGPTVGTPGNLGGTENGSAPAGDHYKEGWYNGFWGVLTATGDPYNGGSWASAPLGVSNDALGNGSWYGLDFSTDETNFTIPNPGYPSAVFPVPVPEPSTFCLLPLAALGFLACRKRRPS